jgi:1-acyl-sn-glycerol-3-phosphate acyltransferase
MAIEAGVPVVPVVIESLKKVINPAAKKYGGTLRVRALAPLQTTELTPKDAPALAHKVQSLMQAEFDRM